MSNTGLDFGNLTLDEYGYCMFHKYTVYLVFTKTILTLKFNYDISTLLPKHVSH